jgi:hypothetical protein
MVDPPAPPGIAQRSAEVKHPSLSEQKMCSDQAEKSFKASSDVAHGTFTDHYDPEAKVCYIEITSRVFDHDKFTYGHVIYDAFEGRVYGSFLSLSNKPEDLMECYVQPLNEPKTVCHSSDEFDALAVKLFGTTQD